MGSSQPCHCFGHLYDAMAGITCWQTHKCALGTAVTFFRLEAAICILSLCSANTLDFKPSRSNYLGAEQKCTRRDKSTCSPRVAFSTVCNHSLRLQGLAAVDQWEGGGRATLAGGACHCHPFPGRPADLFDPVQRRWRGVLHALIDVLQFC